MERTECKEKVFALLGKTTERLSPRFSQTGHIAVMEKICPLVDALAAEQMCQSVEAGVDEAMLRLTISMTGVDMVMDTGAYSPFFELIGLVNSFSFEKSEEDGVLLKLNVDGLWEAVG